MQTDTDRILDIKVLRTHWGCDTYRNGFHQSLGVQLFTLFQKRRTNQLTWEDIYGILRKIAKKQLSPVRELRSFLWRTVEVCSLSLWKTEGWLTGRASRPWADSPAQEGADAGPDRRTPQCSIRKLWGSWGVGGPWRQPPGAETPAPCLPGQQRCEGWTPESVCFLPGWD